MAGGAPLLLLLVDDDPVQAEAIRLGLGGSRAGDVRLADVETVTTLEETTDRLLQAPAPDLVLLDIGLPDAPSDPLGGLEGLLELPSCPPVIVLTNSPDDLGQRAVRMGAQDFLPKHEATLRVLGRTIAHAIQRHARTEQLDRQHRELLRANALLQHTTATIAHDVRGPLAVGITALEALRRHGHEMDPDQREDFYQIALRRLTGLSAQVSDIVDAVSSRGDDRRRELDLDEELAWVVQLLDPALSARLTLVNASRGGTRFWAERGLCRQALQNLVTNAVHHNPDVPVRIEVEVTHEQPDAIIRLVDDGGGLPAGLDVFGVGVTTGADRTGLGLSAVRLAVESMGGSVATCTSPLGGAGFVLRLPQRSAARTAVEL